MAPRQPRRPARFHPRAGNTRGLRSTAADTSDTSTPTGKISTNVIGSRNIGLAYSVLNDSICARSEEHTSELQSLMRISYAVFCLKKKNRKTKQTHTQQQPPNKTTIQ